MKWQKNVLLKNYTTFKIGGRAKYFFTAKTKPGLVEAIKQAKKQGLPFFILGGGSNLLISEKGYDGLVIKIENCKLKIENCRITVEAGVALSKLVNISAKRSLSGLEWAAGIPGTIGGAVRGNAGAFGSEIKDAVMDVEVFDWRVQKTKIIKNRDCNFAYRSSIFKKNPNLIILSAKLKFKKGSKQKIKKEIREHLDYRASHHPKEPSAGSIFKNFTPHRNKISGAGPIIPARELIDRASLKGKKIGSAQISKVHSNFIVNLGGAKSKDVLQLISLVKKEINKKFKIKVKEEIKIL